MAAKFCNYKILRSYPDGKGHTVFIVAWGDGTITSHAV